MLKTFVVVAALTSVALAQSNASSTLIPSGISQDCSSFLSELNEDAQLATCAKALTGALSAFAPGSTTTPTTASISGALGSICSDTISGSCPSTLIEGKLTDFYKKCAPELTSNPNDQVIAWYDTLYVLSPFQRAVCAKEDAGGYCVMSANITSGASADSIQKSLYTQSGQVVVPNASAFSTNNVPFLFVSPDLPEEQLCQPCTRQILTPYLVSAGNIPIAMGIQNSPLLKTQTALVNAVNDKCGPSFMNSQIQAAGAIKGGFGSSSSAAAPAAELNTLMAAVAGLMTLAVAAF